MKHAEHRHHRANHRKTAGPAPGGRIRGAAAAALGALLSAPAAAQIAFTEVTGQTGIADREESYGVGWGDFDGDGWPDLFSNKHQYLPTRVFFNDRAAGAPGGRGFSDLAEDVLLDQVPGPSEFRLSDDTHGLSFADIDNDGHLDILEITGAGDTFPIWQNEGSGTFEYRGGEWGFDYPAPEWAFRPGLMPIGGRDALFFDYNDAAGSNPPRPDGRLDVMVTARQNFVAYGQGSAMFRQTGTPAAPVFVLDQSTGVVNDESAGIHPSVSCMFAGLADFNGDRTLDVVCSDESRLTKILDPTTLPFGDLRALVGEEIFERYPADLGLGDFNNDLRTDIFMPGAAGGTETSLVTPVGSNAVHGWFRAGIQSGSGFSFNAQGNVTFEFDWWHEVDQVFIGADGEHPPLSADLPTLPDQGVGHGDPHHVFFTLSPEEARGIQAPDPQVDRGVYIGYVDGQWRVRLSGIGERSWQIGMRVVADSAISNLAVAGEGIVFGQRTNGGAVLFLQAADHELVNSPGNVQAVNRSCTAVTLGDFDNDMDLDAYFACTGALSNLPNLLYRNDFNWSTGSTRLVAVTDGFGAVGQMPDGVADAVVSADYDLDGCLDLYVTNGHLFRPFSYPGRHQLFRNGCNYGNRWIQADLVGAGPPLSNRDGVGATVYASTPDGRVQMREQDGGKHRKATDSARIHFGLGANQRVDLEVHWPSGVSEVFRNQAVDRVVTLAEGTGETASPPGSQQSCGAPSYTVTAEPRVYAWQSCSADGSPTGQWSVRFTGGSDGSATHYAGTIVSGAALTGIAGVDLEPWDNLDTSDPSAVAFDFPLIGEDGIDFTRASGASGCLAFTRSPWGAQVLLGAGRTPGPLSFNLSDGGPCEQ